MPEAPFVCDRRHAWLPTPGQPRVTVQVTVAGALVLPAGSVAVIATMWRPAAGSVRASGLAMVFKLLGAAQERWRYVNAPTWSRWSGRPDV